MFLDTNVLASALMGHGLCRDLLARITVGHEVIVGEPLLDELRRVLIEKFRVPPEVWRRVELKLREFEQAPASSLSVSAVIPDPDDIPIMACALAAGVDVIVTGDKALVEIGKIDAIPILTPRQLWQWLG